MDGVVGKRENFAIHAKLKRWTMDKERKKKVWKAWAVINTAFEPKHPFCASIYFSKRSASEHASKLKILKYIPVKVEEL